MRRLAPLLLMITLAACARTDLPAQPGSGGWGAPENAGGNWTPVTEKSLEKWASFPVAADPRPLVLIGEPVDIKEGFKGDEGKTAFLDGRVDANGQVPPEAAEAFAMLTKPGAGEPKLKVLSVKKGTAKFNSDRGPRELPAWIFELTETLGPVTVLAVKPDYHVGYAMFGATVATDGLTLTVTMPKATEPCPGETRITYRPQWLESPTAVAVGLEPVTGDVVPGQRGNCAHDLALRTADYTFKLDKPLGNRVLVDADGNPMPAVSS